MSVTSVPPKDESWRPSRPVPPLLRDTITDDEPPTAPSAIPRVLYLLLALVPLMLGAIVILVRTGVVANPNRASRTPWDLGIILLGCAVCLVMALIVARRAPGLYARSKGMGFDQKESGVELVVLVSTIPIAFGFAVLALVAWAGFLGRAPGGSDPMAGPLLASVAILVAGAPSAWFSTATALRMRAIEERFPDLLRDLNESYAAGMTMAQAIRVASRGDYGKLNPEIRRMANQVSWGTSFPDALHMFSERVQTPLVTRAVALVIKATRAGGNVKDVLAAAARDAREIKAIEGDRRTGMALYVIVIYVAFGVFLAVTAALQGLLIPSVLQSTQGLSGIGSVRFGNNLDITDFRHIFFSVGLVQAIGSGIVAGVMSEGTVSAGLKHATVMTGITALVLGLLV
jgi:flagellar protein FlaJ